MSTGQNSVPASSASPIRRTLAQHPLISFFGMAFAFSWLAVLPLILSRAGILSVQLPVESFQILGALAGPTLAALIVTGAIEDWPGIRQFLRRYIQWRAGLQWYLIIIFGPLVALTLAAFVLLGISLLQDFLQNLPAVLTFFLPTLIVGVILGPLWEEPGWRGFALPRLQAGRGPVVGTVILGHLWAVFHLLAYLGGWLGPLTLSAFFALLISSVAFSILTRGSSTTRAAAFC